MATYKLRGSVDKIESMKKLEKDIYKLRMKFKDLVYTFLEFSLEYLEIKAKENIENTVDPSFSTGELANSFVHFIEENVGLLSNYCEYAIYVEFGTGWVGSLSQHPLAEGFTFRGTPWVFMDRNGNFIQTRGQVAHRYMYNALNDYIYKGGIEQCFKKAFELYL